MHQEGGVIVESPAYGQIAEFEDPDSLIAAAHRTREAGYTHVEAYSPFPIHGLAEALNFNDWRIPWFAFFGGLAGMFVGFSGLYYTNVVDYPWNVGGKPLNSWPQFIPITFECTILFAAGTAFLSQFILNGLPRLHHSIFNAPNFDRASQDRFFLFIETTDPQYDPETTRTFLRGLNGSLSVNMVER